MCMHASQVVATRRAAVWGCILKVRVDMFTPVVGHSQTQTCLVFAADWKINEQN